MRLDRLEISGFKSFPDRADVAFDRGVTAIVGPNGCGKSNLVDAITWVLGEQSARSLRGERMEDVIFSGSDARKATGTAEVRLRLSGVPAETPRTEPVPLPPGFDGQDPNLTIRPLDLVSAETREVEIARRLYRSGESEYLIDGEGCRLRDVQDLLMDAGVGVKAYAVIEQGKIGQILSAKPTERRQLIEEAAGVTKYRSRRRAAELKLEAAQQNLTRVDDIIFELDKQCSALKRQAAKTRRYKRLRAELRRWEKVLYARRYRALSQQIEAAQARLNQAREREADAAVRLTGVEQAFDEARTALLRADDLLRESRDRMHGRQLENDRRDQQLAFDRQQLEALSATAQELTAELAVLEGRRGPAQADLEQAGLAAQQADEDRRQAQAAYEEVAREAATRQEAFTSLEAEVEAARGRLFASQNTVVTLQYAIERARDGRARLVERLERLDAEAADARIELARLHAEAAEGQRRLSDAQNAIAEAKASRGTMEAALSAQRGDRERRRADLRTADRDLAALVARLHSLEELAAHREGYGDAARLVLSDTARGIQHQGSVADYLETESDSERVIEALLGELLECVIVADYAEAEKGLAFVRERNAGRIGFLVAGGARRPVPIVEPGPGVLPVKSLIRIIGPFTDAIEEALSDLWVADTADSARAASHRVAGAVATREGDVYRGGRIVYGGGRSAARGILGTKREIKQLRLKHGEVQTAVHTAAEALSALDDQIAITEAGLVSMSAELHSQEKAIVAADLQIERTRAELDRLQRRQTLIATERQQAEGEYKLLDEREAEASANIVRIEDERRGLQEALDETQRRLAAMREAVLEAGQRASEARAHHAALIERATAARTNVGRLEFAAAELEERIAQRLNDRRRSDERRTQLESAIAEGERLQLANRDVLAVLTAEVERAAEEAASRRHQADAHDAAARQSRHQLEEIRAEAAHAGVLCATAEADLNHLATSCVEALQLSLEEVAAEIEGEGSGDIELALIAADEESDDESPDVAETDSEDAEPVETAAQRRAVTAEEAIAELRAKIDRLGPVNMMAIEQFEELEERQGFLSAQRKDLIDSIATTGEAIRRIDVTTRERFQEAFNAINLNFDETFRTLFGGGRAGVVLIDESNALESGIDIIAQPPGKRLQNVQLLSGGEKALTAMALMFGIFKYRPSPFCLLDEIDAPLDDANIGRFIEMLRGMQDRTQFILVTHHRKTMEIADRLYGVTMEEPGVSKLISLRLN